ncbi:LacI family DNA-binding transcriptional regulator [Microbispora sp. ATCC PTA-5024]|uniref:LacI family DNA-binding transcriptional regulator n=1 Tax=Microbispora sp. ATCC PTA-5024 TaxID=316330 RepID=UPI0003DBBB72|nr:LacI family DNA-binding transcriptional regulator [Microbispora sp. ATCC PTA-5024]ETK34974.1 LacI family transcriptional regulator [Microbispora sp. ATCC PTA-5024]
MPGAKVTIYQVAERAGVSPATVSRVLNGARVSAESERLVLAAAAELDFTPNRTARRLRRQYSEVIALVIPDVENPFFTALARGVENRARAGGYSVVLCNTDDDPARESTYLDIALAEHMAGVILAPADDASDVSRLIARRCPVVAVDRRLSRQDVDAVTVDNRAGGLSAARSLFADGFSRVACITGPSSVETAQLRMEGWLQATRDRHGAGDDALLRYADYRVDGGRAAMAELLALPEPPDAAVVANNLMAAGALDALHDAGLTPHGFGLAVFGDLPFASFERRGIRVVDLPARELGEAAAGLLLDRIGGDDGPPRTVVLRTDRRAKERQ